MLFLLLSTVAIAAEPANVADSEPTPQQRQLLLTFHSELIEITPGRGRYPAGGPALPPTRFRVSKYEVTQDLWASVMNHNPSRWKGPRNSVEMLTYSDAQTFCRRATIMMRKLKLIGANEVVRLPTELEWEYVASAGTKTAYSFGDDARQLGEYAWFSGNAAGNDPPVGAKLPNPWGLFDVHGYLWEWCARDPSTTRSTATLDETIETTAAIRGGSWQETPDKLTSQSRKVVSKDLRDAGRRPPLHRCGATAVRAIYAVARKR